MAGDSNISVPSQPLPSSDYSPPYPWQETGIILFLVLLLGTVFIRWLPGYLTRRENDARAARDAAWRAELRRDEDEKLLRDTLLSRHLNQSQTVMDDLLATQKAIVAIGDAQAEQTRLMRTAYTHVIKQQRLQSELLEVVVHQMKGLRVDAANLAKSQSGSQSDMLTRPKGVGQSPYQSIKLENSGIDC